MTKSATKSKRKITHKSTDISKSDRDVYVNWELQQRKEALSTRLNRAVTEELCKGLLILRVYRKIIPNEEAKAEGIMSELQLANNNLQREDIVGSLLKVLKITRAKRMEQAYVVTYVTNQGIVKKDLYEIQVQKHTLNPGLCYQELFSAEQEAKAALFRLSDEARYTRIAISNFALPLQWHVDAPFGDFRNNFVGLVPLRNTSEYSPRLSMWMDGVEPFRNQVILFQAAVSKCITTLILCIKTVQMQRMTFDSATEGPQLPAEIWNKIEEMLTGVKPEADRCAVPNAESIMGSSMVYYV
jgi:hypothetical protein